MKSLLAVLFFAVSASAQTPYSELYQNLSNTSPPVLQSWWIEHPAGVTGLTITNPTTRLPQALNLSGYFSTDFTGGTFTLNTTALAADLPVPTSVTAAINSAVTAITPASESYTFPTRTLGTAFKIHDTRAALVFYNVSVSAGLTISGGASGTVIFEYADDQAMTTNVKTLPAGPGGQTGTVLVGINTTQIVVVPCHGKIPAGKWVRIRTSNTTGTPTFAFLGAQEVLQ